MNMQIFFNRPDSTLSRRLLAVGILGVLALAGPGFAQSTAWPTKPVRIVTGWPPGGNADAISRILADAIRKRGSNPGKISYGSLGVASINHLTGELFKLTAGIDASHVPYKGGSPMLTDLAGGQIQFAFDSLGSTLPLIRAGKIKPLAVTSPQRLTA